jgi:hypothetical protein
MAFAPKTDFGGLTALSDKIVVRDDALNGSVEKYQPQGQDGSFDMGTEVFGEDTAPSNTYGLKAPGLDLEAGVLKLNAVTMVEGKAFALESLEFETGAGTPVKISTKSKEIETGTDANVQSFYSIPALKLETKQRAQIPFGAFTLSGKGCSLTSCKCTIGGSINVDKVAGVKISSDINSGLITLSGTILRSGNVAENEVPTITPLAEAVELGNGKTSKWVLTKAPAPTEKNPETEYQTYEFELELPLLKDGE